MKTLKRIESDPIIKSEADLKVFWDAIENPKPPNENLIRASQDYIKFLNNKNNFEKNIKRI